VRGPVSKNPIKTHWQARPCPAGRRAGAVLVTDRMKLICQHCREYLRLAELKAAQNPMTLVRRWWNTARRFNDDER
jgi:hypothetical protein